MDSIRITGLCILAFGIFLFFSPFLTSGVNPDVFLGLRGLHGLIVALLGGLVLAANSFRKRVRLQGVGMLLAVGGWTTFVAGALISFAGFLLERGVPCFCPASGPCACFVPLYHAMFYAGFVAALVGLVSIVGGSIISWNKPAKFETPGPPHIGKKRVGKRTVAVLAIALTVVVLFGLFSFWPGVYITGIDESTQFTGGMPFPSPLPFMTSPTGQPDSGFHLPLGGSFTYILHFNSVSSYPTYRIDTISVNSGFSMSSNVSLPLVISAADPSVSVVLHMNGPYYPYYGVLSFFLTIENLDGSGS